jgi:hypothetical protein
MNYDQQAALVSGITRKQIAEVAHGATDYNLLNAKVLVFNTILDKMSKGKANEAMDILNRIMRDDPDEVIRLLELASDSQKSMIRRLLGSAVDSIPGIAGVLGGSTQ